MLRKRWAVSTCTQPAVNRRCTWPLCQTRSGLSKSALLTRSDTNARTLTTTTDAMTTNVTLERSAAIESFFTVESEWLVALHRVRRERPRGVRVREHHAHLVGGRGARVDRARGRVLVGARPLEAFAGRDGEGRAELHVDGVRPVRGLVQVLGRGGRPLL